jgi:hypothetical protein
MPDHGPLPERAPTLRQLLPLVGYLLFAQLWLRLLPKKPRPPIGSCSPPPPVPQQAPSLVRNGFISAAYLFPPLIVGPILLLWLPPTPRDWYLALAALTGVVGVVGVIRGLAQLGFWQRLSELGNGDHLTVLGNFVLAPVALLAPIRKALVDEQAELEGLVLGLDGTQQVLLAVPLAPWALALLSLPVFILISIPPGQVYRRDVLLAAGLLGVAIFALYPNVPGAVAAVLFPVVGPPYVYCARRVGLVVPATAIVALPSLVIYLLVSV